tara:strand:+ start:1543 stop:3741 length:2199 start_codon:yes stop_codon:yes gene_type:complete
MEENLRLLKPYLRGIPIILIAMILAFIITSKNLSYVTPTYESTAKLKLADVSEGVPGSNLFKNLDVFATANKITAEIEVIKSEVLINMVLDQIDFELKVFRLGRIKTVELYDQSPIIIHYKVLNSSVYDRRFDVNVINDDVYEIRFEENTPFIQWKMGDTLHTPELDLMIEVNDTLLMQKPYLQLEDNYQFELVSRKQLLTEIKEHLDVTAVDDNVAVVRISYSSANPQKACLFANKLAQAYITDYIDYKYKAADIAVNFLDNQIDLVFDKLSKSEDDIQSYRDKKGITNIQQETETELRRIAQLKIQQTNLKMNLDAIIELETYMQEGKEDFMDLAPNFESFTDLLSTEIVKKIKMYQAENRDLLIKYTPNHEKIISNKAKIHDLTSYLLESITNTRKNMESKYNNLTKDIETAQKVFIGIPEKEKLLMVMNREFSIYQESYNFLNKKKIEAQIARAAKISFHRIITPAKVATEPVSPNKVIIIMVSVLLGMFFAILFIFIVHMVKARVNDKETIETNSFVPIAMVVPLLETLKEKLNYFLQEAVQLEVKGLIHEKSIICFSGFDKHDGATFCSYNLANALKNQGRRILFIDAENTLGFTAGINIGVIPIEDNFDAMTLTDFSFNRFTKTKMQEFLKPYREKYDAIVILNQDLEFQKSLLLMSVSTTNLVVMDTRLTLAKRIVDVDLMNQEFKLPNVRFVLNRYAYNPSIFFDAQQYVRELIGKIKLKIQK